MHAALTVASLLAALAAADATAGEMVRLGVEGRSAQPLPPIHLLAVAF